MASHIIDPANVSCVLEKNVYSVVIRCVLHMVVY